MCGGLTFLWRVRRRLPRPGEIVIFNRSHYEEVLSAKVREPGFPEVIDQWCELINRLEAKIVKHGTPPNREWCRNWTVSQILTDTMEAMKLTHPNPRLDIRAIKKRLRPAA